MKKSFWLIFFLALFLRLFRVGAPVLKEDEFITVAGAAYVYHCQLDQSRCRYQPSSFKDRLLALMTANETTPNLLAEVYLWDYIKDRASDIHHSRAWPQLYAAAAVYHWLGINEFSSRLVSVVAGSLLVIAGYWLSRSLCSSVKLSLLYSGLLAVSFPLIDFSRNARFYSLYALIFLLTVALAYKAKWWLALPLLVLAYFLQMLTLILPVAILGWSIWERRYRVTGFLLGGLALTAGLSYYLGIDFFGRQFLTLPWPPQWRYFNWWWILSTIILLVKKQKFLLSIISVYYLVLIFFTRPTPGAAYVIALWPLSLWPLINWRRWLTGLVVVMVLLDFTSKINYLYFGRDDRAQIPAAYGVILNNFEPGDKIYAIQLKDYYLQDLPENTLVIDLQQNPDPKFDGSGFVVWEQEKTGFLKPETIEYIKSNFKYLGSGGVEIYSFGK